MVSENLTSTCAPGRSGDRSEIDRQKKLLEDYYGSLRQLYDAVSEAILIVNQDRQIVFFNSAVPSLLGVDNPESLYGLRHGEALGCVYSCKSPNGCGTSDFCSQCGTLTAMLAALSGKADVQECRLLKKDAIEAFDLLVRTTPLEVQGQMFSIAAITDISHEKRRRALEHIFFHDIMNTVSSINLCAKMLYAEPESKSAGAFRQNLMAGIDLLIDELHSQKELLAAETNELVVKMQPVDGYSLVTGVVEVFRNRFCDHKIVVHAAPDDNLILKTDRGLLHRVLGNMIRNAIEASGREDVISVSCAAKDGYAEFRVHNTSHLPQDVQMRIFQRSFSTKGAGRGLGTYSMKLLSERYLNGRIEFSSSLQHGTTFTARYPL